MICRICGNQEGNTRFQVREMMYGTREAFDYLECGGCGALQILEVPGDLARHYPADFYSFLPPSLKQNAVRTFLRDHRARHYLGLPSFVGRLAAHGEARRPSLFRFLKAAGATQETPILDVGCGNGQRLALLGLHGFKDLTGIDPFLQKDLHFNEHFRVLRKGLEEEERRYPFVMMHHAFEHMPEPLAVLKRVKGLLAGEGTLLLRIPLAGTHCWRHFGTDWVQLDAPRHLFLHTERSMALLAEAAGLRIKEVVYDSDAFQLWGSEQYRRGIPLNDPRSQALTGTLFSPREMRAFTMEAKRLNEARDGDQACFLLRA